VLLDHGSAMNHPDLAGNCHSLVVACFANGRPRAAAFLASRGAPLDLEGAAGIGRLDVVKRFFHDDGSLKSTATPQQLQNGFLWACAHGHDSVAEFLLDHGADLHSPGTSGASGLHWAAGGGHVNTVKLLLARLSRRGPDEIQHA